MRAWIKSNPKLYYSVYTSTGFQKKKKSFVLIIYEKLKLNILSWYLFFWDNFNLIYEKLKLNILLKII